MTKQEDSRSIPLLAVFYKLTALRRAAFTAAEQGLKPHLQVTSYKHPVKMTAGSVVGRRPGKRRNSILKESPGRNTFHERRSIGFKKRVSFSGTNIVKEYKAQHCGNTEWNSSYELPAPHHDSSNSTLPTPTTNRSVRFDGNDGGVIETAPPPPQPQPQPQPQVTSEVEQKSDEGILGQDVDDELDCDNTTNFLKKFLSLTSEQPSTVTTTTTSTTRPKILTSNHSVPQSKMSQPPSPPQPPSPTADTDNTHTQQEFLAQFLSLPSSSSSSNPSPPSLSPAEENDDTGNTHNFLNKFLALPSASPSPESSDMPSPKLFVSSSPPDTPQPSPSLPCQSSPTITSPTPYPIPSITIHTLQSSSSPSTSSPTPSHSPKVSSSPSTPSPTSNPPPSSSLTSKHTPKSSSPSHNLSILQPLPHIAPSTPKPISTAPIPSPLPPTPLQCPTWCSAKPGSTLHRPKHGVYKWNLQEVEGDKWSVLLVHSSLCLYLTVKHCEPYHFIISKATNNLKAKNMIHPVGKLVLGVVECRLETAVSGLEDVMVCEAGPALDQVLQVYLSMQDLLVELNLIKFSFVTKFTENSIQVLMSSYRNHVSLEVEVRLQPPSPLPSDPYALIPNVNIKIGKLRKESVEAVIADVPPGEQQILRLMKAVYQLVKSGTC